jgi:hypothetical protein
MRFSYGMMDERKILLYKPELFLKGNDLLVFPSKEFYKWHGDIKECIDGLYQINALNMQKGKFVNKSEVELAAGVLNIITDELEHVFDRESVSDFSYHYISALDEKYKKRRLNGYTSDMRRCDIQIPVKPEITHLLKERNMMDIVNEVNKDFIMARRKGQKKIK